MVVIAEHVAYLRLQASKRYNIDQETCHLGHLILEGLLQYPDQINQVSRSLVNIEINNKNLNMLYSVQMIRRTFSLLFVKKLYHLY